jgi:hypothetical protein
MRNDVRRGNVLNGRTFLHGKSVEKSMLVVQVQAPEWFAPTLGLRKSYEGGRRNP